MEQMDALGEGQGRNNHLGWLNLNVEVSVHVDITLARDAGELRRLCVQVMLDDGGCCVWGVVVLFLLRLDWGRYLVLQVILNDSWGSV